LLPFEYAPSSSALAVLGRARNQPPQSAALSTLIAQASQAVNQDKDEEHEEDEFIDIDTMDLDEFIDPQLRALSTTQIGIQRLQGRSNTYKPSTLPPRLYQTNPFAQQTEPTNSDEIQYQMTAKQVPATEKEIQDIEEDEADEIALSQVVETMLATTRAGRKRKATSKVVENAKQAKTGGRGG
jgi:hypothetical protein